MKTYRVNVYCRKSGAIGAFYWKFFNISAVEDATREQLRDAWMEQFGHTASDESARYEMALLKVAAA